MKFKISKKKVGILIAVVAVIVIIIAAANSSDKKDSLPPLEKEGYTLVFNDEFNSRELDDGKWLGAYLPHGSDKQNGSKATYTLENSCLNLAINEKTPAYSSSTKMRVSSVQTYEKGLLHPGAGTMNYSKPEPFNGYATQYGYFEMRAKLPECGGGGHIAWWLIGTQDDAGKNGKGSTQTGEIDILENLFSDINTFTPKVHAWSDPELTEYEESVKVKGNFTEEYHIFAMNWTPEGLTFYVDGKEIASTDQSPQYRMCMLLGIYTDCDWSGEANEVYPKQFSIDYIRIYKDSAGYPNAVTRSSQSAAQPEDDAEQYDAQPLTDEIKNEKKTNLLKGVTLKTIADFADGQTTAAMLDGDFSTATVSVDGPDFPDEYKFAWKDKKDIGTVRIAATYGAGQGATYIKIDVHKDGKWVNDGYVNVNWYGNSETPEYADLKLTKGDGIDGIKFNIMNANLEWKHYVINELQAFEKE